MNVINAHEANARVEEVEEVPTRAQQLQREVYRVPPDVLDQVPSEKEAGEKIAEVPKSVSFVEKSELCSSYSMSIIWSKNNRLQVKSQFAKTRGLGNPLSCLVMVRPC
ncbi:hypothetical protein GOP47_0019256 [Adiantum capillus-veneris]|uniref:Uncharacterized protein n=1 Tax=Adiantum capillus-veneris TaxID=13818 RepID=A0A9D4UF95_ADICA|nr:hypothetical protein GOP47_0019256 [Adiantum capillus-veneris]